MLSIAFWTFAFLCSVVGVPIITYRALNNEASSTYSERIGFTFLSGVMSTILVAVIYGFVNLITSIN